jgi:NAD+ synthase
VRSIGAKQITGLFLPSPTPPKEDNNDVASLGTWFGIPIHTFSLQPVLAGYQEVMSASKVAWGNLTSRICMNLLYLYANEHHLLVFGTSNRTEWYTGYFTKYGDSTADVQPIMHLLKDEVYTIASYLQIPSVFIEKISSAGLHEGQTDEADLQMNYVTLNASLRSLDQHN